MRRFVTTLAWCLILWDPASASRGDTPTLAPRSWNFDHDAEGRVTLRRDPAGREAQYRYDSSGRLEQVDYSDSKSVSYTYMANGLRESMTDSTGTTRYEYDSLGRPQSVSFPGNHLVKYQYDLRGRLRRIELSDGWWITYEYDLLDRLVSVDSKICRVQYTYFPNHRVDGRTEPKTVRTLPNGITTTWNFDPDMRLISLRHERADALLIGWSYQYDGWGRIKEIIERPSTSRVGYRFDTIGRLTEVVVNGQRTESYAYDSGSNLMTALRLDETLNMLYDRFGQLVGAGAEQFQHNAAGDMVLRQAKERFLRYSFDAAGRLSGATGDRSVIRYAYDGDGNLVLRENGEKAERFVYHLATRLPEVLASFGANGEVRSHHLLGPRRLAVRDHSGAVTFFLEDHLGSVRVTVDANGRIGQPIDFSAFGACATDADNAFGFGFTGEWKDANTGLVYLRARWYDPELGRFISQDPVLGDIAEPVSLNRYAYAWNDPVNWVDRSGAVPEKPWWQDLLDWNYAKQWYAQAAEHSLSRGTFGGAMEATAWDIIGGMIPGQATTSGQAKAGIMWSIVPGAGTSRVLSGLGAGRAFVSSLINSAEGRPIRASLDILGLGGTALGERARALPGKIFTEPMYKLGERGQYEFNFATGGRQLVWGFGRADVTRQAEQFRSASDGIRNFGLARRAYDLPGAFDGNTSSRSPNVGGVYLKAAAELLGQVGPIHGVRYDRETGRLVLLGDGRTTGGPPIRLDDLAVALRAALADEAPGISIDPDPKDPRGPIMHFRYLGSTEGTHAGAVMGLADRWMKVIGMGEDNENPGIEIHPKIAGFKDQFKLAFERGGTGQRELWCRFWLVPDKIQFEVSPDGKTLWCKQATIKVNTQVMELRDGRLEPAKGRTDPAAEAFADFFTKHYDQIAGEYPVYEELRQLTKLVGFAAWLKTQLPSDVFSELVDAFPVHQIPTPKTTRSLTRTRSNDSGSLTLTIFGGVDLTPQVPRQPAKSPELAAIDTEFTRRPSPVMTPAVRDIQLADRIVRALEIPLAARNAAGSLTLQASDLPSPIADEQPLALTRHYNSTHTAPGPFGRGWQLLIPELRVQTTNGKRQLTLTDPWRTFHRPMNEPQFGGSLTLENHTLVEAVLRGTDGTVWEFGRNHKLRRFQAGDTEWRCEWDGVTLHSVTVQQGGKLVWRADLFYNATGQITSLKDSSGHTVSFDYDGFQRLIAARSADDSVEYRYDEAHHLTFIERDGVKQSFECDADGILLGAIDGFGSSVKFARELLPDGRTRVRSDNSGAEWLFDSRGRLVRVARGEQVLEQQWDDRGMTQKLSAGGQPIVHVRHDALSKTIERELPGDRREVYQLAPDGRPKSAQFVAEVGGSRVDILFDGDGRVTHATDPAGGAYGHQRRSEGIHEIVTPSGRYSILIDKAGQAVTFRTPSGKEWAWGSDAKNEPNMFVSKGESGAWRWSRTAPGSWELTESGNRVARLRTDESGNISEMEVTGATVRAAHGDGGTVVTTPEGRQLVVRRDATGQILELQEHPAGTPRPAIPLPDLAGKRKVQEKLEKLQPLKKR